MLTDEIKGKDVEEIKKMGEQEIYELLGIPISHTRKKCALLSIKTVQGGLSQC